MFVRYKTLVYRLPDGTEEGRNFQQVGQTACCQEALDGELLSFRDINEFSKKPVRLPVVCIMTREFDGEEGYTPSSFCPFCGARHELMEVEVEEWEQTVKAVTVTTQRATWHKKETR